VKETMVQRSCDFKSFHGPPSHLALLMRPRGPTGKVRYDCICSDSCLFQESLTLRAGPYMTMPTQTCMGHAEKHSRPRLLNFGLTL
jgi:hypothetical protein